MQKNMIDIFKSTETFIHLFDISSSVL